MILLILTLLVMPGAGEGVRAWIDMDCIQQNARIVIPTGNTASAFTFSGLESGVNCQTSGSIPEKSWSINTLDGTPVYTYIRNETGRVFETPVKLPVLTLSSGIYEVKVQGGFGAQVSVEYTVNTPGGGGQGTITENKGTVATIEGDGGTSHPNPGYFTVPHGSWVVNFKAGGPDNGGSSDNIRSYAIRDTISGDDLYSYFEEIGKEPNEILGPLNRLVLGPGTYMVTVHGKTGASVSVSYDLISPDPNTANRTPVLLSLTASPAEPGSTGAPVVWTALASDPDGDQIYYQYFLRGPGGGEKRNVRDWLADRTWTWHPEETGEYQIEVVIRDDHHAGSVSFDDQMTRGYGIVAGKSELRALFDFSPPSGPAPLPVRFIDRSTGDPSEWSWDFGDGEISHEQNPSHSYTKAGSYTVRLSVQNESGDVATKSGSVAVTGGENSISAGFTYGPKDKNDPQVIQFTDRSSGEVDSYAWDFGNGGYSSERSPEQSYPEPGSYTVTLTVKNRFGSDTITKTIKVGEKEILVSPEVVSVAPSPTEAKSTSTLTPVITEIPSTPEQTASPTSAPVSGGELFKSQYQSEVGIFEATNTMVFTIDKAGRVQGEITGHASSKRSDGTDTLDGRNSLTGMYDAGAGRLSLQGFISNRWSSGQTIDFDMKYEAERSGDTFVGVVSLYDVHSTVCPTTTFELSAYRVQSPDESVPAATYTYDDKNCRWVVV